MSIRSFARDLRASAVEGLAADVAIWRYGPGLLAGHALCFLFLCSGGRLTILLDRVDPICWPFLESCWRLRFESAGAVSLLMGAYLAITVSGLICWRQKLTGAFWVLLALGTLSLILIVSLDYRFRQNQFYMFIWINLTYLLSRNKRRALILSVVAFYFFAGLLKLNYEWLSGAVLYRPLFLLPRELDPIACGYVVFLELVVVWGLLSRRPWVVLSVVAQLVLFHLVSLSQVGWFYPTLMMAIDSIVILGMLAPEAENGRSSSYLGSGRGWPAFACFGLLQLVPRLFPGDSVLTGEGRIFALHMFEARQQCKVSVRVHGEKGGAEPISILRKNLPPRLVCDPIVYYGTVRNMCRQGAYGGGAIDLVMEAKRATDSFFRKIIDAKDFCNTVKEYRTIWHNPWLQG